MESDLNFMYIGIMEIIMEIIKWENKRIILESDPKYKDIVEEFYNEVHLKIVQNFFDFIEDKYYIIRKDCVSEDDIKKICSYPTSAEEYGDME